MARQTGQNVRGVSVALMGFLLAGASVHAESSWTQDYAGAQERARQSNKDLMIYFSGSDWCSTCDKLDREVLTQAEFIENAEAAYVLVQIDFPKTKELDEATKARNDELQREFTDKYQLEGYPTLYLATADGSPYAKTGYQAEGVGTFLTHLDFLKMARPMVDPGSHWIEDMAVAQAKAAYLGKDILMDFTGSDWCGWCIKLEDQVFSKAAFKEKATEAFVFVKLDFPHARKLPAHIVSQNRRLWDEYSSKYGLRGYPTIYLATAEGVPYGMASYAAVTAEVYADALVEMREDNLKTRQQAPSQEDEDS